MKNFDEKRSARMGADRKFQIGGEMFVRRASVRPEALSDWGAIDESTPMVDQLKVIDKLILDLVESDDNAARRWAAIRKREDDALSLADMVDVMTWLIEEQTGRTPTQPPSPSGNGHDETGTPSMDVSSLPVDLTVPTAST